MGRPSDLYDPRFVQGLFDEMSQTYGVVNLIASFGFAHRWRKQCVGLINVPVGGHALDLMAGMGELSAGLRGLVGAGGRVTGLDLSSAMCERAAGQAARWRGLDGGGAGGAGGVGVVQADALCCPLADGSVDAVYCSFGLKTLDAGQTEALAREVCRVLRPGGRLAFLEISVPRAGWLRWPYMLYLKRLIPVIGALLLGNPDNYRLLGVYTERFGDCGSAASAFERAGLALTRHRFFAGCATGFSGRKAGG